MLRSDLCDYGDAYYVVKGTIDLLVAAANKNDKAQKIVAFKNNAPFRLRISLHEINSILIDNAEDLQMVNHLNITKIVGKTPQRPERPGNERDAD